MGKVERNSGQRWKDFRVKQKYLPENPLKEERFSGQNGKGGSVVGAKLLEGGKVVGAKGERKC